MTYSILMILTIVIYKVLHELKLVNRYSIMGLLLLCLSVMVTDPKIQYSLENITLLGFGIFISAIMLHKVKEMESNSIVGALVLPWFFLVGIRLNNIIELAFFIIAIELLIFIYMGREIFKKKRLLTNFANNFLVKSIVLVMIVLIYGSVKKTYMFVEFSGTGAEPLLQKLLLIGSVYILGLLGSFELNTNLGKIKGKSSQLYIETISFILLPYVIGPSIRAVYHEESLLLNDMFFSIVMMTIMVLFLYRWIINNKLCYGEKHNLLASYNVSYLFFALILSGNIESHEYLLLLGVNFLGLQLLKKNKFFIAKKWIWYVMMSFPLTPLFIYKMNILNELVSESSTLFSIVFGLFSLLTVLLVYKLDSSEVG